LYVIVNNDRYIHDCMFGLGPMVAIDMGIGNGYGYEGFNRNYSTIG